MLPHDLQDPTYIPTHNCLMDIAKMGLTTYKQHHSKLGRDVLAETEQKIDRAMKQARAPRTTQQATVHVLTHRRQTATGQDRQIHKQRQTQTDKQTQTGQKTEHRQTD